MRADVSPETKAVHDAETIYTKAAKAELERDYDHAFRLYLKTAESFLHISRSTSDDRVRAACKATAGKALERAEKIKSVNRNLAPVTVDIFSEQEQFRVLMQSPSINGLRIPLWNERASTAGPSYEDPDGQPQLSSEQQKHSPVWRRPDGARMAIASCQLLPQDIVQLIVDDCSVSASLSVCLTHRIRFASKLGLSALHPQDSQQLPRVSENGQYILRVLFNGAYRRVVIDDRLPFSADGGRLLCLSTGTKDVLWPSLVEKGYMKLMGGYDFPGSNSCIDLHALTGWIPEHIDIKSPTFERERTWTRILDGFSQGHCVLTVGTPECRSQATSWNETTLLSAHCLAVTDVKEVEGERLLTVLDSKVLGVSEGPPGSAEYEARPLSIPWDDVCAIFEGVYVSWNPALFAEQLTFHGTWKTKNATEDADDGQSSHRHLSLVVRTPPNANPNNNNVWVLLTRHTYQRKRGIEFISLRVDTKDEELLSKPKSPTTVASSKGRYTSSTHVLVRTQASGGTLSIMASYDGPFDEVGFTVTAYASAPLAWDQNIPKAPFTMKVSGTLTSKNSGGHSALPTYILNPQYHLRIHPTKEVRGHQRASGILRSASKAEVVFVAQGPRDVPVNVSAVWSQGERIAELAQKEVAACSGPYSYRLARVVQELSVGDYTVIISAFEPHHTGPFSLRLESTHRFDLKSIPQEGAGMYNKTVRGAWDTQTAVGGPSFKRYTNNPMFELDVASPTQVIIRLQLIKPCSFISTNLTVFPAPPSSSSPPVLGRHIATSGPYTDAVTGAAVPQTTLSAGRYLLVPSTYNPGAEAAFRLLVYSTAPVQVTPR